MDADELMDKWQSKTKSWNFEGDSGLERMEGLFKTVGYGHHFRFGDPIQAFLSDNPGACEALYEWFTEQLEHNPEWKELIAQSIGLDPEEDEESEDEE